MNILITPAEVAALAFGSPPATDGHISESSIISAQHKFIKPVLNGLYDKLLQGEYAALLDEYIKPALAHYVRFLVLPAIATQVGTIGVIQGRGPGFMAADAQTVRRLRRRARADANALMRRAVEHVESLRSDYPEYDPAKNVLNRVSISSDIIL